MNLAPFIKQRFFDANGAPLAGGKLYTYTANTTTPQATYTDQGGLTANANPVILDANGEAPIWLDPSLSYKFILKDSLDSIQWTVDAVAGSMTIPATTITTAMMVADSVTSTILANHASVDGSRAVSTNHIKDLNVTTGKLAANVLSADATGRGKMADGFLSADATGLAKMSNGFLSADATGLAKVADGFLSADAGGRAKMANGFVTQEKRAALGHQISASSSVYSTTSTGDSDIFSLSITTTGRPILLMAIPDGSIQVNSLSVSGNGLATGYLKVKRDTTQIAKIAIIQRAIGVADVRVAVPSNFMLIDAPAAGTYTYYVYGSTGGSGATLHVEYIKLIAFEL